MKFIFSLHHIRYNGRCCLLYGYGWDLQFEQNQLAILLSLSVLVCVCARVSVCMNIGAWVAYCKQVSQQQVLTIPHGRDYITTTVQSITFDLYPITTNLNMSSSIRQIRHYLPDFPQTQEVVRKTQLL